MKSLIIGCLFCVGAFAAPDCQKNYRFSNRTGDGPLNPSQEFVPVVGGGSISPTYDNRTSACNAWLVVYDSEGFSGLSITFQDAPTANGAVGSFITFAGTTVSGSNPMTATTSALFTGTGYYPYFNMLLTSAVGTGSINVTLYGWKSPNYIVSLGGTGGTYTPATCKITATGAAITIDKNTCTNGATNGTATAVGVAPYINYELNGNNQVAITVSTANWAQGNPSLVVTNGGSTPTAWTWPINFIPTPFIYPVVGKSTPIQPSYYDATTYFLYQGPNTDGVSTGSLITAPSCVAGVTPPVGTYPSGAYYLWPDITDLVPHIMDIVTCTIKGTYAKVAAGSANTFAKGVNSDGTLATQAISGTAPVTLSGAGAIGCVTCLTTATGGAIAPGVIDLVNQGAALTAQALFTPSASGFYEVEFYSKITQAASTSSALGFGTTNGLIVTFTAHENEKGAVRIQHQHRRHAPCIGGALYHAGMGA